MPVTEIYIEMKMKKKNGSTLRWHLSFKVNIKIN